MAIDKRLQVFDAEGNPVDYDILATDVKFQDGEDLPTKLAELEEEIGEGGYTPPPGGIPATDLAPAVQTSLAKADSAYQKPATGIPASDIAAGVIPDVSGLATKTEVNTGLAGKVDKETGKSLMSDAEHTKLQNLPSNPVQSISVNGGAAQTPTNGNVNINVDGVAGKSAYQVALDNGFSGTEAQWLASLKGDDGEQGATGPQGIQGPPGAQGNSGVGNADNFESVNNLDGGTTDTANKVYVLGANMGKELADRCKQLGGYYNQITKDGEPMSQKYVESSGRISSSGTATTTVAFYPITGNALSVLVGLTANSATRVFSFATTLGQTAGLVSATNPAQMGTQGALSEVVIENYDTQYKYLVLCYNNTVEPIVKEYIPAVDIETTINAVAEMEPIVDNLNPKIDEIFDENDCTLNGFVKYTSPGGIDNVGTGTWFHSDYIDIPAGATDYEYTASFGNSSSSSGLAWYDADHNFVAGLQNESNTKTGTIPEGATCFRFTSKVNETVSVRFTGGGYELWESQFTQQITGEVDAKIAGYGRTFSQTINDDDCIYNGYIKKADGDVTVDTGWKHSDYIEVFGTTMQIVSTFTSSASGIAFYDSSKQFLTNGGVAITSGTTNVNIPSTAKYVRISSKANNTIAVTMSVSGSEGLQMSIDTLEEEVGSTAKKYRHIIIFGNSFSEDACTHISDIAGHLGLDPANSLQYVYDSGKTLEQWATATSCSAPTTAFGAGLTPASNTVDAILALNWDVIVFQQASAKSADYANYVPFMSQLINRVFTTCPNRNVKIAFHMTWEGNSTGNATTYAGIISAVKSLKEDYGHIIDLIIPTGTAIENIRNTSLADGNNGFAYETPMWHLAHGVGEYVASCCVFQALFGDLVEGTIYDDTTSVAQSATNGSLTGSVAVNDNNRELCQKAAMYAIIHPWGVTDIDNIS